MKINVEDHLPISVRNFMHFRLPERLALYKMLSSLVKGGTPIDVCLRRLLERKMERNRPDIYIIKKWLIRMDQGDAFHDAIRDEVPDQERVLIASGSMSDDLSGGLDQAIFASSGVQKIQNIVKKGLSQPVVLICLVFGLMVGFAKYMAPDFAKMLPQSQWTGYSGFLLYVSVNIANYWAYYLVAIALAIVIFVRSLTRWSGETRNKFDCYFPYSIYRSYNSSSFLIALSGLLKSGVPIDVALKRIRKNSSPWMSWHLNKMLLNMGRGYDPGIAMETGLIDEDTSDQLFIYSKSADFSTALKDLGAESIDLGIISIEKKTNLAKGLALLCIGGAVMWIQLSMLDLQSKLSVSTSNNSSQIQK